MEIVLSKQSIKFLGKQTGKPKIRLENAIKNLMELSGDIKRIGKNRYRYKIEHYRILFSIENEKIYIDEINTRTNIKY